MSTNRPRIKISKTLRSTVILGFKFCIRIIDPSAGSPTETLLRLLLPLSNKVNLTFQILNELPRQVSVRNIHRIAQSVGATGGVYKEQGRNQHKMLTCAYETFLVGVPQLQETIP